MKRRPFALLFLSLLAISSCDGTPRPEPPKKEPAPETSIHDPIDKANALEDQVMKAKLEQDAKIEEQGG
jgi:hypothetical protein